MRPGITLLAATMARAISSPCCWLLSLCRDDIGSGGAHAGASHEARSASSFLMAMSSRPSFRRRSMKSETSPFAGSSGKRTTLDLLGNTVQCGADHLLVLLALLVIVAENEDAPVLEVWR